MERTIIVRTRDEMENRMNDLIMQNYKIRREGDNYVVLGKNTYGKLHWHFLFLLSCGVLNIIYMAYSYVVNYDKIIIKLEERPLEKESIKKPLEKEPVEELVEEDSIENISED